MPSKGIFGKGICSQHFPYTLFVASARDFCKFESSPHRKCPSRGTPSLFPSGSSAALTQVTAEDMGRGPGPALAALSPGGCIQTATNPMGSPGDSQLVSLSSRAGEHHSSAYKLSLVLSEQTAPCKNGRKERFGAVDGEKNSKNDVGRNFTGFHPAL